MVAREKEPLVQRITKDGSCHRIKRQLLLKCEGEIAKLFKGRDGC